MRSSVVPDAIAAAAERLSPRPVLAIEEVRKGGNSRVFRIATAEQTYALKKYPEADQRDRQGAEARALEFFERRDIAGTPRLANLDRNGRITLLTWVEGADPGALSDDDVEHFAEFQVRLHDMIDERARREIGEASEACTSGARILSHIRSRLDRLSAVAHADAALSAFLAERFVPALRRFEDSGRRLYRELGLEFDAELPSAQHTLIPSDFGAHNALRATDGRLQFIDFEYFGWDDPLTSVGNFVLHPGMQLTPRQQDIYASRLIDRFGGQCLRRNEALLPLFALRWCTIILGDFLPERWRHRMEANTSLDDWDALKNQQLAKAERLLARFWSGGDR